jgi:hypothetical protein
MTVLGGASAAWLASQREALNQRFVKARRRFAALDGERVMARLAAVLPMVAGEEPGASELCSEVYDLVLLHEGRGTFASRPALLTLLEHGFAALRPALLADPRSLPSDLSNAVEAQGDRANAYVEGLIALRDTPIAELRLAGAVLAWRLGDARLRHAVIARLGELAPRTMLIALGLEDWPLHAAPLAVRGLGLDAWRHPRSWARESTLQDKLQTEQAITKLGTGPATISVVARIGDFAGFGGPFDNPPLLHDGGDRHRFLVSDGDRRWMLEGDVFGWHAHRDADDGERTTISAKGGSKVAQLMRKVVERGDRLELDGTLRLGASSGFVPGLERARSYRLGDRIVAACFEHSHRIRIAIPVGAPA